MSNQWSFDGVTFDPCFDRNRLSKQIGRIWEVMIDGEWRTLDEITAHTHDPQASVSAQLRNLRKHEFGGYRVNRRTRGDRDHGLYEYQLLKPIEMQTELALEKHA